MSWKSILIVLLIALLTHVIFRESLNNHANPASNRTSSIKYEAPLLCDSESEYIVPHSYIVCLAPGYSLEQHAAAINMDAAVFVHHAYAFIKEQVHYIARPVEETLLKAIRSDPKVEDVQCEPDVVLFN